MGPDNYSKDIEEREKKEKGYKYRKEYYIYLDKLRESGVTNMFGASPYLVKRFGMDRGKAIAVLSDWMKTFGDRHPKILREADMDA
jgi:hypothetical protein